MAKPTESPRPKRKYTKRKPAKAEPDKRIRPAPREYEVYEEGHQRLARFKNQHRIEVWQGSTWGNPRVFNPAEVSWTSPGRVPVADALKFSLALAEACALAATWTLERAGKPVKAFTITPDSLDKNVKEGRRW